MGRYSQRKGGGRGHAWVKPSDGGEEMYAMAEKRGRIMVFGAFRTVLPQSRVLEIGRVHFHLTSLRHDMRGKKSLPNVHDM